jgi:hypothetical protein
METLLLTSKGVGLSMNAEETECMFNRQAAIKFKQEVKHYCLRFVNSLLIFGISKNYLISGRSQLLCQFTKRPIKLTVVNIVGYHIYHC